MAVLQYYFFVVSFVAGQESGIAIIIATTIQEAEKCLRSAGKYNGRPQLYRIVQYKNVGKYFGASYGLMLESYVDSKITYDAFVSVMDDIVGPPGESVYDLAVEYEGYTGTKQQFIDEIWSVVTGAARIDRIEGVGTWLAQAHTLNEALSEVPEELRRSGFVLNIREQNSGNAVSWQFISNYYTEVSWYNPSNWKEKQYPGVEWLFE